MISKSPSRKEPTEREGNGHGENIQRRAFQDWLEERKRAERERQGPSGRAGPERHGAETESSIRILERFLIGRIPARWES